MYQVIDGKTGSPANKRFYALRKNASRAADRLDNKYGAYRYRAVKVDGFNDAHIDAYRAYLHDQARGRIPMRNMRDLDKIMGR